MVNLAEKNQALGVSQCLPNPLLLLAQPGLSPVVRETLAGRKQESCLVLKGSLRAWQEEESQNKATKNFGTKTFTINSESSYAENI